MPQTPSPLLYIDRCEPLVLKCPDKGPSDRAAWPFTLSSSGRPEHDPRRAYSRRPLGALLGPARGRGPTMTVCDLHAVGPPPSFYSDHRYPAGRQSMPGRPIPTGRTLDWGFEAPLHSCAPLLLLFSPPSAGPWSSGHSSAGILVT